MVQGKKWRVGYTHTHTHTHRSGTEKLSPLSLGMWMSLYIRLVCMFDIFQKTAGKINVSVRNTDLGQPDTSAGKPDAPAPGAGCGVAAWPKAMLWQEPPPSND